MAALATPQLATTVTGLGVTDRSVPSMFRRGFQGLGPQNPVDTLSARTSARAATKQTRRVHRGSKRFPSFAVSATGGMNLVFVGAEMAPWSKTGGLGDVLGGLPPAMAANGHRVMVISPRYDQYKDAWDTSVLVQIKVADRYETVRFFHCYKRGVDRVFIDHPWFLEKVWGKTGEKIYGPDTGTDYKDNQLRFSLLCQAALEAPRILNLNNNPYYSGPYVADRYETVRFFHCYKRGVDRVFIDHPWFLEKVWGKTGEKIYGPDTGTDYKDNQLRFSLFCQAALEAPRILNLNNNPYYSGPYGEEVVFMCNDWHTGPLACYLKNNYQPYGIYKTAKVAFCIHNISYQGRFSKDDFRLLNLPERFKSSFDFLDGYDKPVEGWKINWMKAGILEADKVLTVSPYYAEELISGIARGCELDNIMRLTGITGIVNGMDVSEWDPSKDKYIAVKYDAATAMEAKALNKEALQAAVGLPVDREIPLVAFVGRLEEQKGPDVMAAAIPEIMEEDVQIVLLGTGKRKFERMLKSAEEKFPGKVRAVVKFNAPLAHHIMAGADLLAVTSRFEPCGLIQLQGMRYGTPCVCASTGGLVDTVVQGRTGFHMGRLSVDCNVVEPGDVQKVATTLKRAIKVVGTPAYQEMVRNCMLQDLSWKGPAKNWEDVLLGLGVAGSEPGIIGEEIAPLAKENVAAP